MTSIDLSGWLCEQLGQASPDLLRAMLPTFVEALMGAEADECEYLPRDLERNGMTADDPRLTTEQRELMHFDFLAGERPDIARLRAIQQVLECIPAPSGSSLQGEIEFGLATLRDLFDAASGDEELLEELFWSLQNVLDMPYGPRPGGRIA